MDDITTTATATKTNINTNSITAATIKTPDAENETPTRIQPDKLVPFTNGVLKRHAPLNHHHHHHHITTPPPPPPNNHQLAHHGPGSPPGSVSYKECLKNYAASMGGHALDGCGEFMPSPTANLAEPTSLTCAACGCHRNFHRREPEEPLHQSPNAPPQHAIEYQPLHRHHPPPPMPARGGSPNSQSPPPISSSYYPSAPHMLLALSAGLAGAQGEGGSPAIAAGGVGVVSTPHAATIGGNSSGRKRFRTKFSTEQKERMHKFADKVDWKIQKRDEEAILEFCSEVGVDKNVFKVWMHNNKSTLGKRDRDGTNIIGNGTTTTGLIGNTTATHYHQNHHHDGQISNGQNQNHHHLHNSNNDSVSPDQHVAVATNGSSSTS